jgi:hypothetical protein
MPYVLIIISFVAMGGPKNTTPTIDHIPFASQVSCKVALAWVSEQLLTSKVHFTASCQPGY